MSQNRINKHIFHWSVSSASTGYKNWAFNFKAHMTKINMEHIIVENAVSSKSYILNNIHEKQLSFLRNYGEISLMELIDRMEAKVN